MNQPQSDGTGGDGLQELLTFVASSRQYEIDPELRDQICNKIIALRAASQAPGTGEGTGIPNTDPARQFPLYELMPDFTLLDRDPQADERLKLYRDIFAEITAKAIPVCDPTSSDPERVRHYTLPVGPLHRAAGKLGFQLFNGERHLADAVKEIARLNALLAALPKPAPDALREARRNQLDILRRYRAGAYAFVETALDDILALSAPVQSGGVQAEVQRSLDTR